MARSSRTFLRTWMLVFLGLGLYADNPGGTELGGWLTYWNSEASMKSVRSAQGRISDAFLFNVQMDRNGKPTLIPSEGDCLRQVLELRRLKSRVWLTAVNDHKDPGGKTALKDRPLTRAIMEEPARRRDHIAKLVDLCRKYKVDGLDLDYENLDPSDRELFSQFVAELSAALHAKGLLFSITLQPKQKENRSVGPGAADWAAIGKVVDRFQIMLYNLHNGRTAPGPVATSSWMEKILDFAAAQCEPSKIVPVLKVSGNEWGSKPREIDFRNIATQRRAADPQRDPDGGTPFWTYQVDHEVRTAYCEDAESLREKIAFLRGKGYSRVVLWSLGVEDPAFWEGSPEPAVPAS